MGNRRTPRKRRKPLGPLPPESTDDDAVITPADIERAKVFWRKYARPQDVDLLDAEIVQGDEFE